MAEWQWTEKFKAKAFDGGFTALHVAASKGYFDSVQLLYLSKKLIRSTDGAESGAQIDGLV